MALCAADLDVDVRTALAMTRQGRRPLRVGTVPVAPPQQPWAVTPS
ncbi:MAG: hypothetical protein ACJ736_06815 [Streptomyces sp.]